ncbi:extracellular solute-binding protein [Roseibium salinum]|nr:extracellular solute-binding protein [Roseibium salinum]
MFAQPRLVEMGALEPIGERIDAWEGKADLQDNLLDLTKAADGGTYYLPIQYVVLYLYYRQDMFDELGLKAPGTCEEFRDAAMKLTRDTDGDGQPDVYGFGFRGGKGGHDHWGSFVLSRGVDFSEGSLTSEAGVAGTQWVVDLFQKDKVFPPSAPNDGFKEVTGAFKAGKTAMTIHHIGSSNGMIEALGNAVSAVPVPECGGGRWTAFGDESTAIFSSAEKQGCGLEMDFLPVECRQQHRVQQGNGPAAGDQDRFGELDTARGAFCARDRSVPALRQSVAEHTGNLGLREHGLAGEHAACSDRRNHRGADERRNRKTSIIPESCRVGGCPADGRAPSIPQSGPIDRDPEQPSALNQAVRNLN